jgi:hypothetical protein
MPGIRYSAENPPPHLVEKIRARLTKVCADWPPSLFEPMIARAAWIEFKYDRAMTDTFRATSLGRERERFESAVSPSFVEVGERPARL